MGKRNNITHVQLEEAKQYADQSIKEGYSEQEDWEDLTDEEFVLKAQHDGERGDVEADVLRKGEL